MKLIYLHSDLTDINKKKIANNKYFFFFDENLCFSL